MIDSLIESKSLWKYLYIFSKAHIFSKAGGPQPANFSKRMIFITAIFHLFCPHFRSSCFKVDPKLKSNNFESWCTLHYSRYIARHFQSLQLVCLTDGWPNFYEKKDESIGWERLRWRTMDKKCKHGKYIVKVHSGK